ncbi:hypothetical protein GCM10010193_31880 [Kitasatospora atroaurantiaca]
MAVSPGEALSRRRARLLGPRLLARRQPRLSRKRGDCPDTKVRAAAESVSPLPIPCGQLGAVDNFVHSRGGLMVKELTPTALSRRTGSLPVAQREIHSEGPSGHPPHSVIEHGE